jgi:CRISPR system Cascade subunit CasD
MGRPREDTTLEEALRTAEWQASEWFVKQTKRAASRRGRPVALETLDLLLDAPSAQTPHLSLRDTPVSFAPRHRQYELRGLVTDQIPLPPRRGEADGDTPAPGDGPPDHDPTTLLRPESPPRSS